MTKETKRKISEANKGENHPMYGKHLSEETKRKISKSLSGENHPMYGRKGENCPNFGKRHSQEAKQKMSKNHAKAMLGKHHTEESKRKMSKARKEKLKGKDNPMYGKTHTKKAKQKISKTHKGKVISEETKRKMRTSAIKRIKKNGKVYPGYNKKACSWFKFFDKINNTRGQYTPSEYYIEKLGYFPDYINFGMKLIIEWDEKYYENQIEKDVRRQQEIQEHFPDFEFMRITYRRII